MQVKKRAKKAYRSKGVNNDPLRAAMALSAYMSEAQREVIVVPLFKARDALGQDFDLHFWRDLADASNVARELSALGIACGYDAVPIFGAFHNALVSLQARHAERGTWAPRAQELEAVKEGVWLHEFQLKHCSMRQFQEAWNAVVRKGKSALLRGHAADVVRPRGQAAAA